MISDYNQTNDKKWIYIYKKKLRVSFVKFFELKINNWNCIEL